MNEISSVPEGASGRKENIRQKIADYYAANQNVFIPRSRIINHAGYTSKGNERDRFRVDLNKIRTKLSDSGLAVYIVRGYDGDVVSEELEVGSNISVPTLWDPVRLYGNPVFEPIIEAATTGTVEKFGTAKRLDFPFPKDGLLLLELLMERYAEDPSVDVPYSLINERRVMEGFGVDKQSPRQCRAKVNKALRRIEGPYHYSLKPGSVSVQSTRLIVENNLDYI